MIDIYHICRVHFFGAGGPKSFNKVGSKGSSRRPGIPGGDLGVYCGALCHQSLVHAELHEPPVPHTMSDHLLFLFYT